jgi:hypothetical protein
MKVLVRYTYPIYAEVDLDAGDMVRVVVDDEAPAQPVEVVDTSFGSVSPRLRARALEVTESIDWPSWDYGWSSASELRIGLDLLDVGVDRTEAILVGQRTPGRIRCPLGIAVGGMTGIDFERDHEPVRTRVRHAEIIAREPRKSVNLSGSAS